MYYGNVEGRNAGLVYMYVYVCIQAIVWDCHEIKIGMARAISGKESRDISPWARGKWGGLLEKA